MAPAEHCYPRIRGSQESRSPQEFKLSCGMIRVCSHSLGLGLLFVVPNIKDDHATRLLYDSERFDN